MQHAKREASMAKTEAKVAAVLGGAPPLISASPVSPATTSASGSSGAPIASLMSPIAPRELFANVVAQGGTAARRERSVTFEDTGDEADEEEEVKEALAALDSAISRLTPLVDDPEIGELLKKKKEQFQILK